MRKFSGYLVLFLVLIGLISAQADSLSTEPEYLTIIEQLLKESSLIIAPGDDWGLQGYFSNYGLPGYTVPVSYNDLPVSDQLLGALPFAWLNTRQNRVSLNLLRPAIAMTPVFADSGKNLSRFDYYRGDYGFLNFSLIVGGNIAEKINWRLFGENLGYDGGYGLLGPNPDPRVLRESISQNYFLDIWKSQGCWTYELGSGYQKFQPGINIPVSHGFIDNLTYLAWSPSGRLKEYRTNFYAGGTAARANGLFKIGAQMTNTYYNVFRSPSIYCYTADGSQASMIIKRIYTYPTSSLTLSLTPTINILSIRNTKDLKQKWSQQSVEYTKSGRTMRLLCQLGSVNQHPIGNLSTSLRLGNYFQFAVHSQLDYYLYPLGYQTEIGGAVKNEVSKPGFSAWQYQAVSQFQTSKQRIQFSLAYILSDFVMPHISSLADTNVTFKHQSLEAPYLKGEYTFQFPWLMTFSGRAIYSPKSYGKNEATIQGWGRLSQELTLFHNNLNLYAAGDLYYLSCSNSLVWFEQLRTIATSDLPYFTDQRLSFGIVAGARIGTFHIFYKIYNVEGRTFAALPGMLYHNCLKIFGIDWTFIN